MTDWNDGGWPVREQPVDTSCSLEFSNRRYGGGQSRNRDGGGGSSRNWRQRSQPNYERGSDAAEPDESLEVPSRFVGRIIGRGGSKISDLQFESGARINVTKETNGDNTIVKLKGSAEQVRKAKDLIAQLTVDRPQYQQQINSQAYQGVAAAPPKETDQAGHFEQDKEIDWISLSQECDKLTKERWERMPNIVKCFYEELAEVSEMPAKDVAAFRQSHNNIVVNRVFEESIGSKPVPNPVRTFEQAFHNYPEILREIRAAGFTTPSPIQSQAWPVLLSGEDLIGIAQTGTGKTLAFLLPAMIHIDGQLTPRDKREGPSVLILAPTRELALQIEREVGKYQYRGIKAVCVYGGGSKKEQVDVITRGVDIVIATPGRLYDLMSSGHLLIDFVTYVVLDEADRMLDMGFEPQIRKVLYKVRPDRQTVMTSATWPAGVRRLANSYMENPVQVYVGSLDLAAVHSVTQTIVMMSDNEEEKFETVLDFARSLQPDEKAIIFCGKKARADYLSTEFTLLNVHCQSIHGDRDQSDREQAVADITDGTVQILVATDVASRGLDITDITHVVNYDFPRNIEEYVHRVGRTGRAGRTGQSISYFTRKDWSQAKELISILEEACQFVPEELRQMSKRYEAWKERKDMDRNQFGGGGGGGGGFRRGGGSRGGTRW